MTAKKKTEEKPDRTEMIGFRVTPYEKQLIERLAAKDKITVSRYVLVAVLADMLLSGDLDAMKYAASRFGVGARYAIRSLFTKVQESEEE